MRDGEIEFWVEIPFRIRYSGHKAERTTREYQGCSAGITVEFIGCPNEDKIFKIVDKHADEIRKACMEDAGE